MTRKLQRASGVLLVIGLLILWQIASTAAWVNPTYLPKVSSIARALLGMAANGELVRHLAASFTRFASGFAIAGALGLIVGVIMGYFRAGYWLLEPLVELLRPLPPPAMIPISILFLGIDDAMKIFVIAFACFFPVVVNTIHGVRAVDRVMLDTARTFGCSTAAILAKVVLPAASPSIVSGLRISLSVALILTVIAEMVASSDGIGFFILDSERSFRIAEMYAGIFVLMLSGYAMNRLFVWIEGRLLSWYFIGERRDER